MALKTLTPAAFRDLIDSGREFTVVDTRDAESFDAWHIQDAIRYRHDGEHPLDVADFTDATGLAEDDTIVTMCAKGIASTHLGEELAAAGFEDVYVVADGMEGWSEVYERVPVPSIEGFDVVQVQRRAKGCLSYFVGSDGEAAVIDPTRHVEEYVELADERGDEITHVFDTHVHADHISGGRALADRVDVPYYLGSNATDRDVEYEYEPLDHADVVEVGSVPIKALHMPGHTSEMTCYLLGSAAIVTGDTIFTDAVGRTELQFGDEDAQNGAQLLYSSLHRTLLAEPDSVTVLPGHVTVTDDGRYVGGTPGDPITTTVGRLRTDLELLSVEEATFVERLTATLPAKPPNYERVIAINTGRKQPEDDREATELELGPNRCAASGD